VQLGPLEIFIIILLIAVLFAGTERYAHWMINTTKDKSEEPLTAEPTAEVEETPAEAVELAPVRDQRVVETGNILDSKVAVGDHIYIDSPVMVQQSSAISCQCSPVSDESSSGCDVRES
jgi:hypothetical protein